MRTAATTPDSKVSTDTSEIAVGTPKISAVIPAKRALIAEVPARAKVALAKNGTPLELDFKQDGTFGLTNMQTPGYSDRRWRITPERNEVCFDMGNPKFIGMQHCYQLFRYGETYTEFHPWTSLASRVALRDGIGV